MNGLTDTQNAGSWRQSARSALIVLTAISLLNYLDRYIVASLVNVLTQPSPNGLGLSGAQVGWLSSGFVIIYLLTSPLFGSLADRRSVAGNADPPLLNLNEIRTGRVSDDQKWKPRGIRSGYQKHP